MSEHDRIVSLLSAVARLPPSRIRADARLGDLGLGSSIALNMLQSRLNEEFGVAPQMSWKTSVQDVLTLVNTGVSGSGAARPSPVASTAPVRPSPPAARPAMDGVRIVGIGIDLEEPAALPEAGDPFYAAHFTPRELDRARDAASARAHLAGIWSVKEAARKAVAELMDVPFTALEVRHDERGRPALVVLAAGAGAALQFHISITHTNSMAAAVVVATTKS